MMIKTQKMRKRVKVIRKRSLLIKRRRGEIVMMMRKRRKVGMEKTMTMMTTE